mgnify:FL=1
MISTNSLEPLGSRTDHPQRHLGSSQTTTMRSFSSTTTFRQQLRQQMRETRQKQTALQQQQAAQHITEQALKLIEQQQAKNIALYLAFDGEISTKPLINQLWQQGKHVYLPVLHPFVHGHLLFLRYLPDTPMKANKFGILEPHLNVKSVLPIEQLDIIFTPLVAFDRLGNRLGMGGGFYDRTLQNSQHRFITVGLAHQCQQVEALPIESWDIPLEHILVG